MEYIHKQLQQSVFDCVGQPTEFDPACIAQLIQVELFRRRQSLAQIQSASLSNSRFLKLFVYSQSGMMLGSMLLTLRVLINVFHKAK